MTVLAIDTSAAYLGLALASGQKVLARLLLEHQATHSEVIIKAVDALLSLSKLKRRDLTGLAVSAGPGSFTGLRIGLVVAQGLALGLGITVAPVSTLRHLASQATGGYDTIWALADARRNLIYAAPFRMEAGVLTRLDSDAVYTPERLAEHISPPVRLTGSGAVAYGPVLLKEGIIMDPAAGRTPDPGFLALEGERKIGQGRGVEPENLRPRYGRPSDAEVNYGLPLDEYRLVQ